MKSKMVLLTAIFFMTISNIALAEKTLESCSYVYEHGKMSESSCLTLSVADGNTDKKTLPAHFRATLGTVRGLDPNYSIVLDTFSWKDKGSNGNWNCDVLDSPKNREILLDYMKNPFMKYVNTGGSSVQIGLETRDTVVGYCNPIFIYFEKK